MSILDKLKSTIQNARNGNKRAKSEATPTPTANPNSDRAAAKSAAPTPTPQESPMAELESVPQITPQAVWEKLEAGEEIALLDIRRSWDHAAMHPKGATPLPIDEIQERLEELDKEKSYVLSCYHGYSSQDATAFLLQQGFRDVKSMEGGFSGWAAAGLPVEGKYE